MFQPLPVSGWSALDHTTGLETRDRLVQLFDKASAFPLTGQEDALTGFQEGRDHVGLSRSAGDPDGGH